MINTLKNSLKDCDNMRCPNCGGQLDEDNYCFECMEFFNQNNDEPDYDSIENNGDSVCLNCTYWSVSPYGRSHGMYCRKGNGQTGPDDTCFEFVQSHSFVSYGDDGQYQFDETSRDIINKLYNWKNSR